MAKLTVALLYRQVSRKCVSSVLDFRLCMLPCLLHHSETTLCVHSSFNEHLSAKCTEDTKLVKELEVLLGKRQLNKNCECSVIAAAKSLQLCLTLRTHRRQPTRLPHPWDSPGKSTRVGCHLLLQCMKEKSESEVAQSCPTLCDPTDCSLPGSSVHGIFQARVLEWRAIAFSSVIAAVFKNILKYH